MWRLTRRALSISLYLPVKMFILNNQHLGMVVQWEDRFYGANRGHTYLGSPEKEYHVTFDEADIFPDFVTISKVGGLLRTPHSSDVESPPPPPSSLPPPPPRPTLSVLLLLLLLLRR
jgi:hypothetical protein